MNTYKAIRVVQVLVIVSAALLGLSWLETDTTTTEEIGGERLDVTYEAIVQNDAGPWPPGTTMTDADAGIPHNAAPLVEFTFTYHHAGDLNPRDEAWTASMHLVATGDGGSPWWSQEHPVVLETNSSTATARVNLTDILSQADDLSNELDMDHQMSITLSVQHESTVTVDDAIRTTRHEAHIDLDPREGYVATNARGDDSSYARTVEEERDGLSLVLFAPALVLEAPAQWLRRRRPPWENIWGLDVAHVQSNPFLQENAMEAPLDEILETARERDALVTVDGTRVHAHLEPPLWAPVPD